MAFDKETIQKVWEKGYVDPNNDSREWRKDQCGAWMQFEQYGNRNSEYGWEIDHITPVSKGGKSILSNLRPLQWQNNAARQEHRLNCVVTAHGIRNREK